MFINAILAYDVVYKKKAFVEAVRSYLTDGSGMFSADSVSADIEDAFREFLNDECDDAYKLFCSNEEYKEQLIDEFIDSMFNYFLEDDYKEVSIYTEENC